MCDYYEEQPVEVVDPHVEIEMPEGFAPDPRISYLTVRKPVDVLIPGYKCECGARWYPDEGDTIEDSLRHYENHKRDWCKLREKHDS